MSPLVAMKRASPHFSSSVALGGKADIEQAVLRRSFYGYTGARETIVAAVTAAVLIIPNYGTEIGSILTYSQVFARTVAPGMVELQKTRLTRSAAEQGNTRGHLQARSGGRLAVVWVVGQV
jgi:hypothetical protein